MTEAQKETLRFYTTNDYLLINGLLWGESAETINKYFEIINQDGRATMKEADEMGYLTLLFEIDALALNDDRHLNNIAVLEKNGKFDYCPIFDQGAGFLSNVMYAPMDIVPKSLIAQTRARPFHTTFNRQIKTMQAMYGKHLELP